MGIATDEKSENGQNMGVLSLIFYQNDILTVLSKQALSSLAKLKSYMILRISDKRIGIGRDHEADEHLRGLANS
ncbi:MAG: hypothetical protein K2M31_03915 [Muribaculaceae bacterium]|nr:hypothetical protein [Muribaculaceae bacterium]